MSFADRATRSQSIPVSLSIVHARERIGDDRADAPVGEPAHSSACAMLANMRNGDEALVADTGRALPLWSGGP
jgi:hypothetical protein